MITPVRLGGFVAVGSNDTCRKPFTQFQVHVNQYYPQLSPMVNVVGLKELQPTLKVTTNKTQFAEDLFLLGLLDGLVGDNPIQEIRCDSILAPKATGPSRCYHGRAKEFTSVDKIG